MIINNKFTDLKLNRCKEKINSNYDNTKECVSHVECNNKTTQERSSASYHQLPHEYLKTIS